MHMNQGPPIKDGGREGAPLMVGAPITCLTMHSTNLKYQTI